MEEIRKPIISIIIPVHNVEKYLKQCLESVVAENGIEKAEILVINDGSTDHSGEIADSYAKKYPAIRVIHQENMGVASARNTGMGMAGGEWLYFMDSDDWIADGAIGQLLKRSRQCPDSDIILFDAWKNSGDKESAWEHFDHETVWTDPSEIKALQRGVLYFPSTGMGTKIPLAAPWDKLYRRRFFGEKGIRFQPELKVLDDMVFNMEAFGFAEKISYYKDKIYHYRLVADSITNSYKESRIGQDRKVWKYINDYMGQTFKDDKWNLAEKDQLMQAYYCRVIKSFSICCRLSFFNRQNRNSFGKKIKYVKEVLGIEPYRMAFGNVEIKGAEWKLKVMILMGRFRLGIGIYLLHLAQNVLAKSLRL